jgi:hypothetical protein
VLDWTNASVAMIRCLCIKLLFDGKYVSHGELYDVSIGCYVCREYDEGVGREPRESCQKIRCG